MDITLKILIYLIYLTLLLMLWHYIDHTLLEKIIRKIRVIMVGLGIVTPGQKMANQKLFVDQMIALASMPAALFSSSMIELPQYKFYTDLVYGFIQYCRRFGTPLGQMMKSLRDGVIKDDRFERKLDADFRGGVAQFLFISAVTWGFVYSAIKLLSLSPSTTIFLIILFLHLSGITTFLYLLRNLRRKLFGSFPVLFGSLYSIQALLSIGLPLGKVVEESGMKRLLSLSDVRLEGVIARMQQVIERVKRSGVPVSDDITQLIDEAWFLQEQAFEDFKKKQMVYKFLVITIFYLSAYFIFILSLFRDFLGQY